MMSAWRFPTETASVCSAAWSSRGVTVRCAACAPMWKKAFMNKIRIVVPCCSMILVIGSSSAAFCGFSFSLAVLISDGDGRATRGQKRWRVCVCARVSVWRLEPK